MKQKTTKKFIRANYHVINSGNGELYHLLNSYNPDYYCTRVEGWACDAYIFGDYAILDGCSCIGKIVIPYEVRKKYDNTAKANWDKYFQKVSPYYTYNRVVSMNRKLIEKFIEEVKTNGWYI